MCQLHETFVPKAEGAAELRPGQLCVASQESRHVPSMVALQLLETKKPHVMPCAIEQHVGQNLWDTMHNLVVMQGLEVVGLCIVIGPAAPAQHPIAWGHAVACQIGTGKLAHRKVGKLMQHCCCLYSVLLQVSLDAVFFVAQWPSTAGLVPAGLSCHCLATHGLVAIPNVGLAADFEVIYCFLASHLQVTCLVMRVVCHVAEGLPAPWAGAANALPHGQLDQVLCACVLSQQGSKNGLELAPIAPTLEKRVVRLGQSYQEQANGVAQPGQCLLQSVCSWF